MIALRRRWVEREFDPWLKANRQRIALIVARGDGKFEPLSWEQAFTEIATTIGPLREREPEARGIFAGTRTGMITIRFGSMPRSTTICRVIALSLSK